MQEPRSDARVRSSSQEFLSAVRPQIAVVQVGRYNPHGHPSEEALGRYRSVNCLMLRTDEDGAITVTSDGKIFEYRTEAESLPRDLNAERESVELWHAL